jgi:adenine/guanine/hypoxanthine permease
MPDVSGGIMKFLNSFFHLRANRTNIKTELLAGVTTYITMVYIIVVNPSILAIAGMDKGAVFVATILAAAVGTLIMGLFANVPFALAPGMGLNAFFTFTVVIALKFTWQQALAMVFICGLVNILVTVTSLRKQLIISIPVHLQHAITAGIGLFIAYIGFKNAHFLDFIVEGYNVVHASLAADGSIQEAVAKDAIPALVNFADPASLTALAGLLVTVVLMLRKIKGAILIGIVFSTLLGLVLGVAKMPEFSTLSLVPPSLAPTFLKFDFASLFGSPMKFFGAVAVILAFSLTDMFDTIGTLIGTGRTSGIFDEKDEKGLEKKQGFSSKLERGLFADAVATSVGAIFGTSNTTTYVESASGISAGGRTGLTAVVVAILFLLSLFLAPFALMVPAAATAPALIVVGILMMSSIHQIDWHKFEDAVPGFFIVAVMPFAFSITTGVAVGLIFYVITMAVQGKAKKVHPLMYCVTGLFLVNFILSAVR